MKSHANCTQTIFHRPFFLAPSRTTLPDSTSLCRFLMTVDLDKPVMFVNMARDALSEVSIARMSVFSVGVKVSFKVSFIVSFPASLARRNLVGFAGTVQYDA